jgi:GNAT superfamily N-acetyltransferase
MSHVIRPVGTLTELTEVFDFLGAQFPQRFTHEDGRFADLARRFPDDRTLMLVAEDEGRIIGGALAFRKNDDVTLRIIALDPAHRGRGAGRDLMDRLEREATALGAREIALGADEAVGFYLRLGYRGRSGMRKQLPLSAARNADADEWRRALDELRKRRARRLSG